MEWEFTGKAEIQQQDKEQITQPYTKKKATYRKRKTTGYFQNYIKSHIDLVKGYTTN
jgi:hypothetical protein